MCSCVTLLIPLRDTWNMAPSYVWHGTFMCVTRLISMYDPLEYVSFLESFSWKDSSMCATCLIRVWSIHVCDTTHSHAWHDSLIHMRWRLQTLGVGSTGATASCKCRKGVFWGPRSTIGVPQWGGGVSNSATVEGGGGVPTRCGGVFSRAFAALDVAWFSWSGVCCAWRHGGRWCGWGGWGVGEKACRGVSAARPSHAE